MERLPVLRPRAYTLPEEKGDSMPKLGAEKPLWMVTSEAGELRMMPVRLSAGKATCRHR